MWKLWQVIILIISLAMWLGWTIWGNKLHNDKLKHQETKDKDHEKEDDSMEIEVIFMINAINFILILLIMD